MSPKAKKKRHENISSTNRPVPIHADYYDEVTDEHLERIRASVEDEDLSEAEVTSGPGW